jgi:glycosyltransferase involved in cell wall biosynthesis
VAVPVKDEVERIGACLRALALQSDRPPDTIVLAINNTTDGTEAAVRALLPVLPVPVTVLESWLPPEQASAGAARRLAMEHAAAMLGSPTDVLLTTDADGRVPPDWVAANLAHMRAGLDAVAGRAVLDPVDAALIPTRLHDDDRDECAYAAELDALAAALDPEPWDPPPRHAEHSGASIAVSLAAYRRAGGMPASPLAEDRHFFAALRRTDARIRHAPEIAVVVSGRTVGRAEGGMADTIRRRLIAPDPYLDDTLEPAVLAARRAELRGGFRRAWHADPRARAAMLPALARRLELPLAALHAACAASYCLEGWSELEAASPALVRRLVPASHVQHELAEARRLRAQLADAPFIEPT